MVTGSVSGGGPHSLVQAKERKSRLVAVHKIISLANMEGKPNVSEVSSFDTTKLKHVKTVEKNTLPSSESK